MRPVGCVIVMRVLWKGWWAVSNICDNRKREPLAAEVLRFRIYEVVSYCKVYLTEFISLILSLSFTLLLHSVFALTVLPAATAPSGTSCVPTMWVPTRCAPALTVELATRPRTTRAPQRPRRLTPTRPIRNPIPTVATVVRPLAIPSCMRVISASILEKLVVKLANRVAITPFASMEEPVSKW